MNSAMGAIVDARLGGAYLGYLESRLNSGFPPPFVAGLILLWVNGGLLCLFSPLSLGWLRFGLGWASAGIGRPSVKITSKHETPLGRDDACPTAWPATTKPGGPRVDHCLSRSTGVRSSDGRLGPAGRTSRAGTPARMGAVRPQPTG